VLTYVGILVVFVQGFLVGWMASRFDEYRLIFLATILMMVSLFGWALVPNIIALLIILAPLALAAGTLNTLLNSTLSKAVYQEEVGGTLGLSASLERSNFSNRRRDLVRKCWSLGAWYSWRLDHDLDCQLCLASVGSKS
jgi:MFS family permease